MILTKQSIMTWTSEEAKNSPPELITQRTAWVRARILEDKTDGDPVELSATTTRRLWVDQAAAEEWATFIQSLCTSLGAGLVSVQISDYTAP